MGASDTDLHFLNIEYFFRLIYETVLSARGPSAHVDLVAFVAHLWILVTVLAFLFTAGVLFVFIYSTMKLRETAAMEAPLYETVHDAHHAEEEIEHHRWTHVLSLIESPHDSDWRQAIIEADIMLDDMLAGQGLPGANVGDKLKAVDPARMQTLQQAWDAHKVRNDIAHQGSSFPLTDHIAYRTIKQYENVFREQHFI